MNELIALINFFDRNDLESDDRGNYRFTAMVNYSSNVKNIVEYTDVKITMEGFNGGKVSIAEEGELNIDDFHLDFLMNRQEYLCDETTGELIINGTSNKMRGAYMVKINPNI